MQVYIAGMQTPQENFAILLQLVSSRHELAATMGHPSFAHFTIGGTTLAATPGAVEAFLHNLSTTLESKVGILLQKVHQTSCVCMLRSC